MNFSRFDLSPSALRNFALLLSVHLSPSVIYFRE